MTIKKWIIAAALIAACLFVPKCAPARAEDAENITSLASITLSNNSTCIPYLTDERYISVWSSKKGYMEISLPQSTPCYGIYLCMSGQASGYTIELPDEAGEWMSYKKIQPSRYLHQFQPLPGVSRFRVRAANEGIMLRIAEMRLLGAGTPPAWVQNWETLEGKADMMLLSAHPDDEVIWFGGALPYYAGELHKKVQVVSLTCATNYRMNELLDCLWTCGVHYYPQVAGFKDERCSTRQKMYAVWGGTKRVFPWLVSILRRYQPDVLLTHALNGEYGHGAHQVAAAASVQCVTLAAKPDYDPDSFAQFGAWQVKKLYLHSYEQNQIVMNWDRPLTEFEGETAFDVAGKALKKHRSQFPLSDEMLESGPYDCRIFGLYMSTVGEDKLKDDFFEHISF